MGAFAPYGYAKAEENKNQLVPDENMQQLLLQDIFCKEVGQA